MNTLYTAIVHNDATLIRSIMKERTRTLSDHDILIAKDVCKNMKREHLLEAFNKLFFIIHRDMYLLVYNCNRQHQPWIQNLQMILRTMYCIYLAYPKGPMVIHPPLLLLKIVIDIRDF
jgi:hypothetical protein